MAWSKDFWAIDPAKLASLKTAQFKTPMQPTYDYSPADQTLSLTEALDKPLYEFSEGELHDLVSELQSMRWAEKETQVREIVRNFMMHYRSAAGNPVYAPQTNTKYVTLELPVRGFRTPHYTAGSGATVTLHSTANSIRISIPTSIPPEFVHAFVERMVRDYFEEA